MQRRVVSGSAVAWDVGKGKDSRAAGDRNQVDLNCMIRRGLPGQVVGLQ
jgi:hypothetical protein